MTTNNLVDTSLSGQTGTVKFVGSTSPTLVTPVLGAVSATSLTFSSTSGVIGSATNDSAATGSVGEYVSSTVLVGSAVSTTNGATTNITTISLTAGDWDVWGSICTTVGAGTTTTRIAGWVNSASATAPTAPGGGTFVYMYIGITAANAVSFFPIGSARFSLSGTTTIYLTGQCNFAVSTMALYGFIGARRVR
jgi:hypothetical protein